jgi:hypothetical protein
MADSASLEDEPRVPFKFFRVVCGHLGYTPGDGQTSWVYSNNPVLHLYISCYVTVNKPVLSYLSLRLLPQFKQKVYFLFAQLNGSFSNRLSFAKQNIFQDVSLFVSGFFVAVH